MALAVSIRFDILDDKGKTSFTKVRVPNGFSIAQYIEFAQAMAQIIADISNGLVTSAGICIGLDLSGATLKAAATAIADVAQKAFFQFNTAVAGLRAKLKIPTLDETILVANSDSVDQLEARSAAFIAGMENGIVTLGGTIQPTNSREDDITAVSLAREVFRKT